MADRIVIPLGDGDWIAVTPEELAVHRATARSMGFGGGGASQRPVVEDAGPLLTAEQLANALQVPQTRIEQASREGTIPHVKLGRWIRYRRGDVEDALTKRGKSA